MLMIVRTVGRGHRRVHEKSDSHGRAAVTTNVTRIQSSDKVHSLARSSTGHHGNEVLAEYDVGVELELGVLIAGS